MHAKHALYHLSYTPILHHLESAGSKTAGLNRDLSYTTYEKTIADWISWMAQSVARPAVNR